MPRNTCGSSAATASSMLLVEALCRLQYPDGFHAFGSPQSQQPPLPERYIRKSCPLCSSGSKHSAHMHELSVVPQSLQRYATWTLSHI
mmetsp:Transcript_10931/g.20237  ORF Transcript_10931/g.20237 Transcript_10931/m.20237 type:complete len:88 (-) Transcript_10931:609-872(-)